MPPPACPTAAVRFIRTLFDVDCAARHEPRIAARCAERRSRTLRSLEGNGHSRDRVFTLSFPLQAVRFPVKDVHYRKSRSLANYGENSRAHILQLIEPYFSGVVGKTLQSGSVKYIDNASGHAVREFKKICDESFVDLSHGFL